MRKRYNYFGRVLLISLILLLLPLLYAPISLAITPEEVLTKFEERLNGLKLYSVQTIEKSKTIGPRGMEESGGQGKTFVKGNKRYSEMSIVRNKGFDKNKSKSLPLSQQEENKIIQVFDGTISWFYDTSKKEVKKVNFSKLPANIQEKIKTSQDKTDLKLPEGIEFTLEEKVLKEEDVKKKEKKKKYYVLTSTNTVTMGGQKYEKIILWIDAEEYLPSKVEMHGKIIVKIPQASNLEIQTQHFQEFKNWEFDVDIPDSRFAFKVPEGIKEIEATEETKILFEKYMKNFSVRNWGRTPIS